VPALVVAAAIETEAPAGLTVVAFIGLESVTVNVFPPVPFDKGITMVLAVMSPLAHVNVLDVAV
jgi:hypothetical protein